MAKSKRRSSRNGEFSVRPERLFELKGPFSIPTSGDSRGYLVDRDAWKLDLKRRVVGFPESFSGGTDKRAGLYLLGRRVGRTVHYFYVGMSERDLIFEVQQPHNGLKTNEHMQGKMGTPVVTFIVFSRRPNDRACPRPLLLQMEKYFIQQALMGGHQLENRHHAHDPDWAVVGLTVRRPGRRTSAAIDFVRHLGVGTPPLLED